jgi:hypothetical protein
MSTYTRAKKSTRRRKRPIRAKSTLSRYTKSRKTGFHGEAKEIIRKFDKAVNMMASEIAAFLRTQESKDVGFTYEGEKESVGRQSARRIIKMLNYGKRMGMKSCPRNADDLRHMRKVIGYVARHSKQRPSGDVRYTRWRYSLMNWGNDPLNIGSL